MFKGILKAGKEEFEGWTWALLSFPFGIVFGAALLGFKNLTIENLTLFFGVVGLIFTVLQTINAIVNRRTAIEMRELENRKFQNAREQQTYQAWNHIVNETLKHRNSLIEAMDFVPQPRRFENTSPSALYEIDTLVQKLELFACSINGNTNCYTTLTFVSGKYLPKVWDWLGKYIEDNRKHEGNEKYAIEFQILVDRIKLDKKVGKPAS